MKKFFCMVLLCEMFVSSFAQTLPPDQYEPNNTAGQARYLGQVPPAGSTPPFHPPGYKKIIQANFHDSTDKSDWYRVMFYNSGIPYGFYWSSMQLYAHNNCYPYKEKVDVVLSGMTSGSSYSLQVKNGGPAQTFDPVLPITVSGTQNISTTINFDGNPCGCSETFLIEVRRIGVEINEGYTLTLSFSQVMPAAPTITSISPTNGPVGTIITITGTNLGLGPIMFKTEGSNNSGCCCFSQGTGTSTSVTTTVPSCAINGPIYATTSFGGAIVESPQRFTVARHDDDPLSGRNRPWFIRSNSMKAGRLLFDFPESNKWKVEIWTMADQDAGSFRYTDNKTSVVLVPGEYRVRLNSVPVLKVPILTEHDTKLRWGYLDVVASGDWTLADESGVINYRTGYKNELLVLPIGYYTLKIGGIEHPVTVKEALKEINKEPYPAQWEITSITGIEKPSLKGSNGQLEMTFPGDSLWKMKISKSGVPEISFTVNDFPIIRRSITPAYELKPGEYYIRLNNRQLDQVPVFSGKKTRIRSGLLKINFKCVLSDSELVINNIIFYKKEYPWRIYDPAHHGFESDDADKFFTGSWSRTVALPIGEYHLYVTSSHHYQVNITDRKTNSVEIPFGFFNVLNPKKFYWALYAGNNSAFTSDTQKTLTLPVGYYTIVWKIENDVYKYHSFNVLSYGSYVIGQEW